MNTYDCFKFERGGANKMRNTFVEFIERYLWLAAIEISKPNNDQFEDG